MPENKREPKRIKSFRLTWYAFETLRRLSIRSGMSEGQVVEIAITEFARNHPEYTERPSEWKERPHD